MCRDLVENQGAERPIEGLQNFAIPVSAAFVQISMVAQIHIRELPERDVRQSADTVAPFQNARPLARLDVLRRALVGSLGRVPIPLPGDLEVVVPVMIAAR